MAQASALLERSIGQSDLMSEERVDDRAFGNVAAFALSRNIGKRAFKLFQISELLPDARQMIAREIQNLATAIVMRIDKAEQAFQLLD